jgi:hypothetical protein
MSGALPEWLFDNFLFKPWPGRWLARDNWEELTLALSIALPLGGAGLFMLEERARRMGQAVPARLYKGVCVALSLLAFLVYFDFGNPNTRYHDYYHRHEFFHYYLGSKYFGEIGYKRIYVCAAIAEVESGRAQQVRNREVRDLSAKNLLVPASQTIIFSDPDQCKRHFTAARWQAFKADVGWFQRVSNGDYWERFFIDHGYNPPPVWTMTGKLLSSLAPAGDHFFKLLALIDVSLQLGVLLLLGWAFGLRVMTCAAIFWGCNAPAQMLWTLGAFMRQDWLFGLVAAICLARKRRFASSGGALAWSTSLRIFPVVAFAGAGLIIALDVLKKKRLAADYRRFILGSVATGVLLFAASAAVVGVDSYAAFASHIDNHKGTPLTNNMGLEMILAHDWDGRMVFTKDDRLDDPMQPWKEAYAARAAQMRPVLWLAAAGVFGWLAWALRRTKLLWIGMCLSLPLLITVLNLTCYYYACFVVAAALVRLRGALGPAYLALAGSSQILLARFYWIDDEYAALSYLFYAFGLCMLYALSRPVASFWAERRRRA